MIDIFGALTLSRQTRRFAVPAIIRLVLATVQSTDYGAADNDGERADFVFLLRSRVVLVIAEVAHCLILASDRGATQPPFRGTSQTGQNFLAEALVTEGTITGAPMARAHESTNAWFWATARARVFAFRRACSRA